MSESKVNKSIGTPHGRKRARRFALQALYQWNVSGEVLSEIESQFLSGQEMRKVDTDYFHTLLHSVPAELDNINDCLKPFLHRAADQITPVELTILQMGTFELQKRLDVPWRVVLNEAIELAKTFGADKSHSFVNGILDKVAHVTRQLEIQSQKAKTKPAG